MNPHTKDTLILTAWLVLMAVWAFHIPYALSDEVMNTFYPHKKPYPIINVFILLCMVACLLLFMVKRFVDSKSSHKVYRICAALLANVAFIFSWLAGFVSSIDFHCQYYWAADCRGIPDVSPCSSFPLDIDIAYLLQCLPLLCMLLLLLYFAFTHKLLSRQNCLYLSVLPFFTLISILLCFRGNGVGCHD